MHGHRADKENGTAVIVQGVGHQRAEGKPGLFARMGGERGDATRVHQRTRTLGEGRFGDRNLTIRRAIRMFSWRRRHRQVLPSGLFHDANWLLPPRKPWSTVSLNLRPRCSNRMQPALVALNPSLKWNVPPT